MSGRISLNQVNEIAQLAVDDLGPQISKAADERGLILSDVDRSRINRRIKELFGNGHFEHREEYQFPLDF